MRVPLNTLISTSDMLASGVYDPLTPKQARAVARLQRNHQRLLAMLDDFVTYAKAEAGEYPLSPTAFDARAKVHEWCDAVRASIDEKQLSLNIQVSESAPNTMTADEPTLRRSVQALLWNAVAATTTGAIEVVLDWSGDQGWRIQVKDSGSGISSEIRPRIFEPFFRGDERPQLPTAGAGLGLPLAQALIKVMGGKLQLVATSPSGSTFEIRLP